MMPILEEAWKEVQDHFGNSDLERIEGMLEILAGVKAPTPAPLQEVSLSEGISIYIPGLSTKHWHSPEAFPWHKQLEASFPQIKEEMLRTVQVKANLEPYSSTYDVSGGILGTQEASPEVLNEFWGATFFYKYFARVDAKCALCPTTAKLIDSVGVAREALFSVLEPGAHIPPHSDRMNFVTTCHLGLLIPDNCALRVGTETRQWEEGRCFFFDSSFEHEAWNRSNSRRVVLLLDVWHPDLKPKEIEVMTHLRPRIEKLLGAQPRAA
ncbi:aspartyl/asparaginyl beta-hydroxylase domain-containing protein [Pyxidicoccus sp. 3LFB2]